MKQNRSRRRIPRKPDALDLTDQALAICRRIEALAALLEVYGRASRRGDDMKPEVIISAGDMIDAEIKKLGEITRGWRR